MNISYKKKSFIKRFVALFMAICCMFSMFPAVAGATDDTESDTTKKNIVIFGCCRNQALHFVLQAQLQGKKMQRLNFKTWVRVNHG